MASLYRKPVVVTDPATGRKIKTKSKKWWGQYKDAHRRLRRVPLGRRQDWPPRQCSTRLVQRVEREKAGLVDPTEEQRKRPLSRARRGIQELPENKGVTPKQVAESTQQAPENGRRPEVEVHRRYRGGRGVGVPGPTCVATA